MTPFPQAERIATNGIELEVFSAGAHGKPLVLCHGWPELAYSWRLQIPALSTEPPAGRPLMSEAELAVFIASFERSGFTGGINWYRNFARNWTILADVEQIVRQPAMMLYGEYDSVAKFDRLADYVPRVETHTLPCGHWIQQEEPATTNQLMLDWLARHYVQ